MFQQILIAALFSMLQFGTPILIAGLGGVISENSGVVNLALEGIMRMGGFFAVVGAYYTGNPWLGLALGIGMGAVMGLLAAWVTVSWRGDQVVYGVAVNVFALGGMTYLLQLFFNTTGHSPPVSSFSSGVVISPTFAQGLLVFLVVGLTYAIVSWSMARMKRSNAKKALILTAVIGLPLGIAFSFFTPAREVVFGAFNKQTIFVYFALILPFLLHFLLYQTKWGLRIRAVGENPKAADTLGINIYVIRYACVILSYVFGAIAGASMSIGQLDIFDNHMPAGKGFIALAAMIFGKWKPLGTLAAVLFFTLAGVAGDLIQGLSTTYPVLASIPRGWLNAFPYMLTLLALAGFVGRAVPPAADGIPYEKGEK
ncbi:MAG: ABC transporter permease [Coprothermobacterota bacterium]|nr:ABC transporter permease [Coprothermobacterota bacterium]